MRTWRTLVVVAALVGVVVPAGPAAAGGWAVTYLDPPPDAFEAGRGYTLGFWVLQHGSHAFDGDLGETGLTLIDESGTATAYAGVRLPEPAHYAAAIAVPRAGRYQVVARQGLFEPYAVGTLSVPGGITIAPTPTPLAVHDDHDDGWGVIRPPIGVPGDGHALAPAADHPATEAPGAAAAPPASRSGMRPPIAVAAVSVAVLAGLGLLARRRVAAAARSTRRGLRDRTAAH